MAWRVSSCASLGFRSGFDDEGGEGGAERVKVNFAFVGPLGDVRPFEVAIEEFGGLRGYVKERAIWRPGLGRLV